MDVNALLTDINDITAQTKSNAKISTIEKY